MQIGILGPLQVTAGEKPVAVTGSRLRALVTRLAVDAPAPVPVGELVEAVWPDEPPADPTNALQSLVSRVRRALGEATRIQQVPGGYRLTVDGVDAARFGALVADGRRELREGRPGPAHELLVTALALWRGEPLADAADGPYAAAARARLDELRLDAQIELIEARLQLGRAAEVVTDLEQLLAAYPLRERPAGQLMRALAGTGRQADALAVYERLRERLAGELGVDPGGEVQGVHLAVLRGELAPAPAAGRRRTNLRVPLTGLIGREQQVARVRDLLGEGRLVTIVGPGGAGKTRLAQEVGRLISADRRDGVWLVELAAVAQEQGIVPAMIGALGLLDTRAVDRRTDRTVRDSTEYLFEVLANVDCLLVVDNCEHLVAPVADLVDELLANSPDLQVLATSREPLGIVGEALCLVPPLGLPPDGASVAEVSAADVVEYPAVRLLVERGRAVSSGFDVHAGNVADVVEIVRRLDGLPLAIELAAARLRVMPIAEITARLSDRFRLLTGGSRTALPRHRTLRAVVEWSWELLTADERLLAERFAVFPAGANPSAVITVCADERLPAHDIPDLVLSLVDKSLLSVVDGSSTRYRMLETIREYGIERLTERGEIETARARHGRYFAGLARRTDPLLRAAGQLDALATLHAEHGNIGAALGYLAESPDPTDRVVSLDLAMDMAWYWQMTGATAEATVLLSTAIAATRDCGHPHLRWAQAMLTMLSTFGEAASAGMDGIRTESRRMAADLMTAGPPPNAGFAMLPVLFALFGNDEPTAGQAMAVEWASSDVWTRSAIAMGRALFAENEGRPADQWPDIEVALAGFEEIGDRWGQSAVLASRGNLRVMDGDNAGGIADYERALTLAGELGSTDDEAMVRMRLAGLLLRTGELTRASEVLDSIRDELDGRPPGFDRELFIGGMRATLDLLGGDLSAANAAAAALRAAHDRRNPDLLRSHALAVVTGITAIIAVHAGDAELAVEDVRAGFPIANATQDMPVIAAVGVAVAWVAAARGRAITAARALGAAARLRGSDDPADPMVSRLARRLSAELGADYEPAYQAGRSLSRPEALAALDPENALGATA